MPWNRVLAAGGVAGLAALAGRYAAGLARAEACDLILKGARGIGTHTGALLGSVARSTIELSAVPVMLVK